MDCGHPRRGKEEALGPEHSAVSWGAREKVGTAQILPLLWADTGWGVPKAKYRCRGGPDVPEPNWGLLTR